MSNLGFYDLVIELTQIRVLNWVLNVSNKARKKRKGEKKKGISLSKTSQSQNILVCVSSAHKQFCACLCALQLAHMQQQQQQHHHQPPTHV